MWPARLDYFYVYSQNIRYFASSRFCVNLCTQKCIGCHKIDILLFTVMQQVEVNNHKLYHCNVEHYLFLAFYLISVVCVHCRSKRFPKYRSIMQSLKRRLSFRKKKDHVPECSKPHQWQEDEKKVREGTCSFQVRVSRFTFPLLLALFQ